MYKSLKSWFSSLDGESKLFDKREEEAIHVALASLLHRIISADHLESEKEKRKFKEIMAREFDLDDEQIAALYRNATALKSDLASDLDTVNDYLKENPHLRMTLLSKLNQLVAIDGATSKELGIFDEAMKAIFPELGKRD